MKTDMQFANHVQFFECAGGKVIRLQGWGSEDHITTEELYQHFKARFIAEVFPDVIDGVLRERGGIQNPNGEAGSA